MKTLGRANSEQASQTQPQLALAVNVWWRGYPREPKAARPYVLRRLLGEMLARRTASHFLRQKLRKPRKVLKVSKSGTSCLKSSRPQSTGNVSILEELSTAAQSEPPHREWLLALRTFGPVLPHCLAVAAASEDVQQQEAVHQLLDGLSPAQAAALLASLDAAALDMGEAAAALRLLWRHYPQRAIVAKWDEHLRSTLEDILSRVLSTT